MRLLGEKRPIAWPEAFLAACRGSIGKVFGGDERSPRRLSRIVDARVNGDAKTLGLVMSCAMAGDSSLWESIGDALFRWHDGVVLATPDERLARACLRDIGLTDDVGTIRDVLSDGIVCVDMADGGRWSSFESVPCGFLAWLSDDVLSCLVVCESRTRRGSWVAESVSMPLPDQGTVGDAMHEEAVRRTGHDRPTALMEAWLREDMLAITSLLAAYGRGMREVVYEPHGRSRVRRARGVSSMRLVSFTTEPTDDDAVHVAELGRLALSAV